MDSLIQIVENEPRVSAITIAENTQNEYDSIRKLIKRYSLELKEFGNIPFTDLKSEKQIQGRSKEVAMLSEPQATLLITFLKNSETVVKFKVALVKAFYELKNEKQNCNQLQPQTLSPDLPYTGGSVGHILHGYGVNPNTLLTVKMITKLEKMFGAKNVREYYSNLLNIKVDDALAELTDAKDGISYFIDTKIELDGTSRVTTQDLYDTYCLWIKDYPDLDEKLSRSQFTKHFAISIGHKAKQIMLNGARPYVFCVKVL